MKKSFTMIIFSMIIVHAYGITPSRVDSLRTENRNGQLFIVHKVDPGQTLYSLSRRYNASIAEVIDANPALSGGFAIKTGQEVSFPQVRKATAPKTVPASPQEVQTPLPKPKEEESEIKERAPAAAVYHLVKDGETVYSISRLYNLPQEELIRLNGIVELKINPDQKLLVNSSYSNALKTTKVKEIAIPEADKKLNKVIIPKEHKGRKIKEVGLAEVINTGNKTSKFLALHRTAPIGSFLNITNEATGDSVQVKVVGNMVESAVDPDILVKISPSAFRQLKPRDSKIRATISYNLPR